MESEPTIIQRGKRVVEERLRQSIERRNAEDIRKSSSPSDDSHSSSHWTVVTLQSEIKTLESVCYAREKEILLLKYQLLQSNKLIEESQNQLRELAQAIDHEGIPDSLNRKTMINHRNIRGKDCRLLESFASASSVTLNNVVGHLEKTLNVTDIHNLPKAIEKSMKFEIKYLEILKAVCGLLDVKPVEVHHRDLLRMLQSMTKRQVELESEQGLKDEIRGRQGVAWTFR
jgi:hypothetical protein